jgi:hypothetical protein
LDLRALNFILDLVLRYEGLNDEAIMAVESHFAKSLAQDYFRVRIVAYE